MIDDIAAKALLEPITPSDFIEIIGVNHAESSFRPGTGSALFTQVGETIFGNPSRPGNSNLFVVGAHGTGTTALAKNYALRLQQNHVALEGSSYAIEAPKLLRDTDQLLQDALFMATHGVLVIDRIDMLARSQSGINILEQLTIHMSNDPGRPIVVATCRPENTTQLFRAWPELAEHFGKRLPLQGYKNEHLAKILIDKLRNEHFKFAEEHLMPQALELIDSIRKAQGPNFAQTCEVIHIMSAIKDYQGYVMSDNAMTNADWERMSPEEKQKAENRLMWLKKLPAYNPDTRQLAEPVSNLTPFKRQNPKKPNAPKPT